ncbi:MAG: MmcQ/YjbR family DNA-binding protein [Bryobacteraceae bacterium]
MTAAGFRKLALKMPEATEGTHHGVADFRVGNKIFATLAYERSGSGVLLLTPEHQEGMVADAPEIFSAVPNAWGRQGATLVKLAAVKPDILESALRTAWLRRTPKRKL